MRLLLTGASGQLGAYILRELTTSSEFDVVAWSGTSVGIRFGVSLQPIDLGDSNTIERSFTATSPDLVIHAAALARVADCHRDPHRAQQINVEASATLARLAHNSGARLLHVSTDLVFDGQRGFYREDDPPNPVSVYGRTKAEAERAVLTNAPRSAVARVSLLFGPSLSGKPSFFDDQIAALTGGRPVTLFSDEWRTPLDLPTAARGLIALVKTDHTGVFHMGGPERLSRLEMGQRLAAVLGVGSTGIVAATRDQAPAPEPRPRDSSLDSSRWRALFPDVAWPTYEESVEKSS